LTDQPTKIKCDCGGPSGGCCYDCGRPYGNEHGFPDLIIPNEIWRRISPTKDNGGLLCPSCIVKRVSDLGCGTYSVVGAFMSGPIKSVDPDLMHTIRWVENLREQGHGWSCPDCNAGREQAAHNGVAEVGAELPRVEEDGPWAWAVVDPNNRLRNQDGNKIDRLICWDYENAQWFRDDANDKREEGEEQSAHIVPLYPQATFITAHADKEKR